MNFRREFIIISVLLFLTLVPVPAVFSKDFGWEFDGSVRSEDWSAYGAFLSFKDGKLNLSSVNSASVYSLNWLKFPPTHNMVRLSIKSTRDSLMAFRLLSNRSRWRYERIFDVKSGERDYDLYIDKDLPLGESFKVEFFVEQNDVDIALDFLRFSEPTFFEEVVFLWQRFWNVEWISLSTINYIKGPMIGSMKFAHLLYILLAVFFLLLILTYLSMKRKISKALVVNACAFSFLLVGLLYAIRMDYNWLKNWQYEINTFSDMQVEERMVSIYTGIGRQDLFPLVDIVKSKVPGGSSVRPLRRYEDIDLWLGRYYMLPVETSLDADYIWTLNDDKVSFSPSERALKVGGRVLLSPVELVAAHSEYTALYRVVKGEER